MFFVHFIGALKLVKGLVDRATGGKWQNGPLHTYLGQSCRVRGLMIEHHCVLDQRNYM